MVRAARLAVVDVIAVIRRARSEARSPGGHVRQSKYIGMYYVLVYLYVRVLCTCASLPVWAMLP